MKINLKESIAGLKQDGKHTPKSIIFIFMLVVICVEVGMIVYSNLVELQYHLGFDASSAYLHAVEMWREKSLIPSTFAITTTLGLDAPDALAALFYGITGNIFLSFGIANLILDVIICISFYQILKEINLTPFTRILGMVFLLCPFMTPDHFTDNNLSYFAMVFGEQGSYSIKIIAMMLLFLTIIKFEHNKKCYKTMIFATLFNMLTCVSSGIYVAITILVPCVVYYLVKMVYENSYKVLKNTGLIFALVELVLSFIGKASTGLIMSFQSHESNMVLTGIHQFWTNIGSLIMGYFQLFCGISIETVVSLFSLRGILQIMSVAFILFMFILCVISVVFLIRHIKAKEKINLYRQHMPAEGKVHEQFCCYMECRILIAQNEITEKLSALLLRAIRYTIPDYLLENCVSRRLYSPVEIELIRMHITYNDRKCECNEVELFLIMDFVTEFYSLKQQEKIEIPLLVDCVKYEIALEKYNRALASIERALDIISVGRSMQYVGELHFLKAQVLSCVQNSIDKNREWQDECKRECFMAYVVFGVMGKKEEKEEIYKYCLEKLNWQITEQMMLSD